MTRIEGVPSHRAGPLARLTYWASRRRLGTVAEPLAIAAHNTWILAAYSTFEVAMQRSRRIDPRLRALASLKASALIGCPY